MASISEVWSEQHTANFNQIRNCPVLQCVSNPTIFHYLKNIKGKTVLDIGCGPGEFGRLAKKKGASYVLGVDCSPAMINYAKLQDEKEKLHCEYQLADARKLGKIGQFDIVTSLNLFHLAETRADLEGFCRGIYENLKPGEFFYGIAFNPYIDLNFGASQSKYGFANMVKLRERGEVSEYQLSAHIPDNPSCFISRVVYFFKPEVYEEILFQVGFKSVEVKPAVVDESERSVSYPDGFWDEFLKNPSYICYVAQK